MAKYKCPLGIIKGKIGGFICQTYRGIPVIKMYKKPNQPYSTIKALKKVKQGKLRKNKIDAASINNHFIFGTITHLAHTYKYNIFYKIWKDYHNYKRPILLPHEKFTKHNISPLCRSIPQKNKLCNSKNAPDWTKIRLAPEAPEPGIPITAGYEKETGKLKVRWSTPTYSRGNPDDETYLIAIYFKQPDLINWTKSNKPWKNLKAWGDTLTQTLTRKDNYAEIQIKQKLNPNYITAFLIFKNDYGYSSHPIIVPYK